MNTTSDAHNQGIAFGFPTMSIAIGVWWYMWGIHGFAWGLVYGFFWPVWFGYRVAMWLVPGGG